MPTLEYNDVARSSEYRSKYKDYSKDPGWYGRVCGDCLERAHKVKEKGRSDVLNNCISAGIKPYSTKSDSDRFSVERMKEISDGQLKFRWEPPLSF